MLEQLEKYWQILLRPATADEWCRRLLGLSNDFFSPTGSQDSLTQRRLETVLDHWLNACTDAGLDDQLTLPVVRSAILTALGDASISQRFLAGKVNFGTLMPMRAIPFKVVCLLGINDGQYPRSRPAPDFDLMAAAGHYRPGDRSRREDDRYLFLEALLSAREKLYVSAIGKSVRDNSPCAPSVLVSQLRDYLASGWTVGGSSAPDDEGGDRLLAQLTCQHPLQPFSRTYFQATREPDRFTYAHEWRRIYDPRQEAPPAGWLDPPQVESSLTLSLLIRFLKNPVQSFFNQRLNVYFEEVEVATLDQEPFDLDPLAPFTLGSRLLEAGLAADAPDDSAGGSADGSAAVREAIRRMQLSGDLPMQGFAELAAADLAKPVERMLTHHFRLRDRFSHPVPAAEIDLPVNLADCGCEALQDWLPDLYRSGLHRSDATAPAAGSQGHARWQFYPWTVLDKRGRFCRPDCLIAPWVYHLAGCAQGLDLTSYLVAPDGVIKLPSLQRELARQWLDAVVVHWWSGLRQPLALAAKTALGYLHARHVEPGADPAKAVDAARYAYQGNGYNAIGELGYSLYLQRVYPDFDAIWQADGKRFVALAEALYAPLIQSYVREL